MYQRGTSTSYYQAPYARCNTVFRLRSSVTSGRVLAAALGMTRYMRPQIDNGGIHMAFSARERRDDPLQVFTAIPRFYGTSPQSARARGRFKAALRKPRSSRRTSSCTRLVLSARRQRTSGEASAGLTKEMERSSALGVGVLHLAQRNERSRDSRSVSRRR